MELSIILPTYNEKENIQILIPRLEELLKKNKIQGEIIVVDDLSPDGTGNAVSSLAKKYKNITLISKAKKEGIGAALRIGYNSAKGNIIASTDTDLSFDVENILNLLKKINQGYDLVVGSRYTKTGFYEVRKFNTFLKYMASKFGNKFLRTITGVKIHDFSANFRVIRCSTWHAIKTKEKTNTLLFEMILLTNYHKFKVGEIPVIFKDRRFGKSKIKLAREIPKFLLKAIFLSIRYKRFNFF